MRPITCAFWLCWLISVQNVHADVLRLQGKDLLARSQSSNLRLSSDGNHVVLDEGVLIEDDGPAAGFSYLPNEERLSDMVWIKKELIVANPAARSASLLVGPGGALKALINGKPVELKNPAKAGNYWQAYAIPPECLIEGKNEIVLYGSGKVWIARAEDFPSGSLDRAKHPNRSARSSDGGKTWDYDKLGPAGNIDGEYYVRLFLDQHRPKGTLITPVLDAANTDQKPIAPPLDKPLPFRVRVEAVKGNAGKVTIRVRTGSTTAPDARNWSDWQPLQNIEVVRNPKGRFCQIAVELTSSDPLFTPSLWTVCIESTAPKEDDWSAKLRIREIDNPDIVRTSIPFEYEPFDHPKLKELRTRFKLDDLVKDSKPELELIERLARWSSQCWEKGHLKDSYPPWDALEILKPHTDGKPVGGFCQQYNVVFLLACASFGIPGRAVSIGVGDHASKHPSPKSSEAALRGSGHEVVELWSNQFKKWIYVDGNMAWYAVDAKSRIPLALAELRERQLAAINDKPFAPIEVIHLREGGKRWTGLTDWPAFLEMRMIPRSNFLQTKSPLPLNQGMRGWFWNGHHVWTDADYPASLLYGNRVFNARNWNWTLNQTHMNFEATATQDELRIHLDTETPGFETFLASIDGNESKPVTSGLIWKLHAGRNRLEVRSRNIAGREGIVSHVVIERLP
jgi:Transglutaminase-like superfamily